MGRQTRKAHLKLPVQAFMHEGLINFEFKNS